jgi:hypothetical protein
MFYMVRFPIRFLLDALRRRQDFGVLEKGNFAGVDNEVFDPSIGTEDETSRRGFLHEETEVTEFYNPETRGIREARSRPS